MSRKYKFHNKEGLYFVSFAVVYRIDVFTREEYFAILTDSLDYCRKNKGMEIYAWCIMPSHVHLIFRAKANNPSVYKVRRLESINIHSFKTFLPYKSDAAGPSDTARSFDPQLSVKLRLSGNSTINPLRCGTLR